MLNIFNCKNFLHVGEKIINSPNVCQKTLDILEDEEYWRKRSCAVSCLHFSMNHYGVDFDSNEIPKLSEKEFNFLDLNSGIEKKYKYFTKQTGWNNYAILQLAREEGLIGKVYSKNFNGVEDFNNFIDGFKKNGIFIVSVDFRGEIDDKIEEGSHLVTIAGFYEDKIYVKNPYDTDEFKEYDLIEFIYSLKGNIIYITDNKNEEFLSFSPIRFEDNNVVQNNDLYLRFELEEGIYIKLFTTDVIEQGFEYLFKKINIKLTKKQKELFKKRIIFIKNYYVQNLPLGKKEY